ncbi:hypothetical protein KP509_39G056700 [Ceratopteris richardii]|uniref:Uncharacterized protein n=1 Tax=Ceratopteris richardii TaxID=49495 RepID=A0A8T2Q1T0_CERRI|nr:hypothetical protein KP509_39G056700 [Ceratopteris richardii]
MGQTCCTDVAAKHVASDIRKQQPVLATRKVLQTMKPFTPNTGQRHAKRIQYPVCKAAAYSPIPTIMRPSSFPLSFCRSTYMVHSTWRGYGGAHVKFRKSSARDVCRSGYVRIQEL